MQDDNFLKYPERRNHQRVDVDVEVNLVVDGQQLKTTASNISCGGIFLPLNQPSIEKKTSLEVTLHLPDTEKAIKVIGEVSRVEKNASSTDQGGVAVRFNGLYDDNILAIDRFIKSKMH